MKRPFVVYAVLGVLLLVCSRWWFADWWLHREYPLGIWETESVTGQVSGVLTAIEQKDSATWYYLKNCTVSLSEEADFQNCDIDSFLVKISYSQSENNSVNSNEMLNEKIILGTRLQASGEIQTFESATNPGQFDSKSYYGQKNLFYQMRSKSFVILEVPAWTVRQMLWEFRQYLAGTIDALWDEPDAGTIKAMLLGDKDTLDSETKSLYTRNGIGHLLAISGLHMSVFAMGLYGLLGCMRISNRLRAGICIVILFAYGYMTGLSVSTNRAMLMMTLFFLAKILGRTFERKNALGFAAIVILIQTPAALYGSSVLLSFGAMTGVCYIYPVWKELIFGPEDRMGRWKKYHQKLAKGNRKKELVWQIKTMLLKMVDSFVFSLGIQMAILPVIAWFYFEIPMYGVFLNLLLLPLMSLLVVTAAAGVFLGGIWMPAGKIPMMLTHIILQLYDKSCRMVERFPGNILLTGKPQMWQMITYYLLVAGVLVGWHVYKKIHEQSHCPMCPILTAKSTHIDRMAEAPPWSGRRIFICFLGMCLMVCVLLPGKIKGFRMVFLDVGQGDCIFFQSEEGSTYLVDGGSSSISGVGTYRILPYLKSQAVKKLDFVWITHLDEDHMNGIVELLSMEDGIPIGTLFLSEASYRDPESERLRFLCEQKQVQVRMMQRGDRISEGVLSVACLYPEGAAPGDYDKNEWSQVLLVRYGEERILLTGDLGTEGEEQLMKNGELEQVQVLKAGHHGSKYSSGDSFLQALGAKVAVFSAGRKNRYGHPHPDTIERMEQWGMEWISTAQAGAVFLQGDTSKMKMWSYIQ